MAPLKPFFEETAMLRKTAAILLVLILAFSLSVPVFAEESVSDKFSDFTYIFSDEELAAMPFQLRILALKHNEAVKNTSTPEEARKYSEFGPNWREVEAEREKNKKPVNIPGFIEAIKKINDIALDIALIIGVLSLAVTGIKIIMGGKMDEIKKILGTCIGAIAVLLLIPNIIVIAANIFKGYAWDPTLGIKEIIQYTNGFGI